MLNRAAYDKYLGFKITNPIADKTIGPCLYRPEESYSDSSRLKLMIDAYLEMEIGKQYNLSITDFLELTASETSLLLERANNFNKKRKETLDDLTAEMEG
jgi:hypothetical protein